MRVSTKTPKLALLLGLMHAMTLSVPAAQGASKKAPGAGTADGAKVWIVRPDGAQSCGMKDGQPTEDAVDELKKAGIAVYDSTKGNDGLMHMQMCGASTGSLNASLISASDLPKAQAIGFKEAPAGFKK